MEFTTYSPPTNYPDTIRKLEEFYGESQPFAKSIFMVLGSYWREFYKDTNIVNVLETGIQNLISQKYLDLMHQVLSSNILDIPVTRERRLHPFVFNSANAEYVCNGGVIKPENLTGTETIQYIRYRIDLQTLASIRAFVNYLVEPSVVLNSDFVEIDPSGYIKFYVDIFRDPGIINETYYSINQSSSVRETYVLLWGVDIVLQSYDIYERYGTYLYRKQADSQDYKLLMTALQFFFVNTKTVNNIESAVNILLGMPFCRSYGEVVTSISPRIERFSNSYVVTTHNTYVVPFYAEIMVEVGDTLSVGSIIGRWSIVSDYLSNPVWPCDYNIPYQLRDTFVNPVVDRDPTVMPLVYDGGFFYNGDYFYKGEYEEYVPTEIYASCRFPFSLLNNLNYPVEYLNFGVYPTFNGAYFYNSLIAYCPSIFNLVDPALALDYASMWYKARKDSNYDIEQWLYWVIERFLKYNVIYIRTCLTLESVYFYKDIWTIFRDLVRGIPFYLFPNIDTVVYAIIEEGILTPDEVMQIKAKLDFDETVMYPGTIFYDSRYTYDGIKYHDRAGSTAVTEDLEFLSSFDFYEHARSGGVEVIPDLIYYDGTYFYDGSQSYSTESGSCSDEEFTITVLVDSVLIAESGDYVVTEDGYFIEIGREDYLYVEDGGIMYTEDDLILEVE